MPELQIAVGHREIGFRAEIGARLIDDVVDQIDQAAERGGPGGDLGSGVCGDPVKVGVRTGAHEHELRLDIPGR